MANLTPDKRMSRELYVRMRAEIAADGCCELCPVAMISIGTTRERTISICDGSCLPPLEKTCRMVGSWPT